MKPSAPTLPLTPDEKAPQRLTLKPLKHASQPAEPEGLELFKVFSIQELEFMIAAINDARPDSKSNARTLTFTAKVQPGHTDFEGKEMCGSFEPWKKKKAPAQLAETAPHPRFLKVS